MEQADISSLIQCNLQQLCLLHPVPHTFKEGMFKLPNIKGFQESMHFLLNIIEPVKCAKMVPWPLLDKKAESQFRISVKTLLMEINGDYPEANLPKISPSFLMNPGGEKFEYFMWKLTKFALFRCLCQTYGTSDMLFPPRTFSNDSLADAKLSLVRAVTESMTQKAIQNQLKIDSLLSQEWERQCSIQLSELEEGIRKYETLLKELVKDSPISTEMKERICCGFDDDVIAEWVAHVEAEGRAIEAVIHVLNKTGTCVTNLVETIKMAENNDDSQLCLDANRLNIHSAYRNSMDDDLEDVMKKMQDGKFSLSELIKSLITLQTSVIHRIEGSRLQDMSNVLPELQTVNAEFQECKIMFSTIETKLQEKLGQVQKSYEELCKDFKISKSKIATKAQGSSPTISPVCAAVSAEDVYITDQTPVRDVNRILCNKQTESGAIANMELDPQLLQTPEIDREFNSPLHTSNLPSARKEYKTPACKSICTFPGTTNKKSHANDLCSLTSSLVQKKKSVGKALQFQSVPRRNVLHHQSRAVPSVSKELFEESLEETQKRSSQIPATSVESKSAISTPSHDCFGDVASGMEISPADLLCSPDPKEAEQQTKGSRRKSLDAIIERYLKVRKNMGCS